MSRFIDSFPETKSINLQSSRYTDLPLVSIKEALEPIEPYIENIQGHGKLAIQQCHFPSEYGLTQEESAAIYLYSMETAPDCFYRLFNKVLRSGNADSIRPWCLYLKLLTEALDKFPVIQASVWRGGTLDNCQEFIEGQQIRWSSFTSCSLSVDVTQHFLKSKGFLFMIETNSARNISKYSMCFAEKEVLLSPGATFTVVSNSMKIRDIQVVHLKETTKNQSVILIGIAGPTGCTRHLYANYLAQRLNSPFEPLLMKTFWRRKVPTTHPKLGKISSGELPESHDIEAFALAIRRIRSSPTQPPPELKRRQGSKIQKPIIVIVDGLLTFGCTDEITSMFDIRIFIDGEQNKCRLERYRRDNRIESKVSNDTIQIPKQWQQNFDDIIWYEYLKRRDEQVKHVGKVFKDIYGDERDFASRDEFIDRSLKELL